MAAIGGLSDLPRAHPLLRPARAADPVAGGAVTPALSSRATGGSTPCAAASKVAKLTSAHTWDQIARAYGFTAAYGAGRLGAGQTVALFELEPYSATDVASFQECFTLPGGDAYGTVTPVSVDGGAGTGPGSGEAILDIEDVQGLAPEAAVRVYEAPNSDAGLLANYGRIVSDDLAKVVSTSWGACESASTSTTTTLVGENEIFGAAAAQGQTVFAAAGDSGSEDCYYTTPTTPTYRDLTTDLAVDDPSSQPYVTGVGGTTMTLGSTATAVRTETVWNEKALSGGSGGGGVSQLWSRPVWQSVTGRPVADRALLGQPGVGHHHHLVPPGPRRGGHRRPVPRRHHLLHGHTQGGAPLLSPHRGLDPHRGDQRGGPPVGRPLHPGRPGVRRHRAGLPEPPPLPAGRGGRQRVPRHHHGHKRLHRPHTGTYAAGTGWDNASGWGTPDGQTSSPPPAKRGRRPPSAALSTTKVAAPGVTYTVHFTTSATGTLGPGDTITLVGRVGTVWPAGTGDYTVPVPAPSRSTR